MRRLSMLFGLGLVSLALLVSAGTTQDAKKDKDVKKDEKKDTKTKGFLPPGFKDLNLTAEQKSKVYTVQAEYKLKIAELNLKIADLKKAENVEVFKVLTDTQREQYLKSKGIDTKDGKDAKDKTPEKDKSAGKN